VIKLCFKYRLFFVLFFILKIGSAQDTIPNLGIKGTFHHGFIAPHKPLVNEVIKGHTQIFELSFYKNTTGQRQWEQYFNNPKIGISGFVINTGNDESLGKAYGVIPFVEMPLNQWKIKWNLKFGFGVGYIEKPFNRIDNYKNLTIGSHLNALIFVNSLWDLPINERFNTSLGLSLTHFSNGSLKRPNLGINLLSVNCGVGYNFGKQKQIVPFNDVNKEKTWNNFVAFSGGVKEIPPIGGKKYLVYSLVYQWIKTTSNKSGFGGGTDVFYNTSLEPLIQRVQNEDKGTIGNVRFGIHGAYQLALGKLTLQLQVGGYAYTAYKDNGNIYSKLNSRYFVTDKLFFNLSLKTHYAVADFIEYGIGFKLK
jgi:hypothetical protein